MATINTTDPKPGFVYDTDTDTWYPLLGISASQSLDELSDVVITTPTTGQILAYNGTGWINQTETGDLTAVTSGTGISVTNGTGPIPTVAVDTAVVATTNNTLTMFAKTLNGATVSNSVIVSPEERALISATAATGTVTIDVLTSTIIYYTSNATGNWTFNFRGANAVPLDDVLAVGDSITVVFLNTNGATPYYPTAFQIDGSAVTPKWQGGTAPAAGNASSIDAYVFSIFLTSASPTYTVLASQTKFA